MYHPADEQDVKEPQQHEKDVIAAQLITLERCIRKLYQLPQDVEAQEWHKPFTRALASVEVQK